MPPPPEAPDVSAWTQLIVNGGIGIGAFIAVAYGYFRASGRNKQGDVEIVGGIVSRRDLEPLTNAVIRVAVVLERRAQQWEEREEAERDRRHSDEVESLRREIRDLKRPS